MTNFVACHSTQVARLPLGALVQMLSQYVQALAACLMDMQGAPLSPD